MKSLFVYFKKRKTQTLLAPLFKMCEAALELVVPYVVALIVDNGIATGDKNYIITRGVILMALGIVGLLFSVVAQYFSAKCATGVCAELKSDVFKQINKLSFSDLDRIGSATIITRMTSDINRLQDGVNLTLRLLLRSPFVVFGAMISAFLIDAVSGSVFAVALPVLFAVVFAILLSGIGLYKKSQKELDDVTTLTTENVTGVRMIRAFAKEDNEVKNFRETNERFTKSQLFAGRISALLNPLTYVIVNMAIVALLYVGAIRVDKGILTNGQVIALYNYISQILIELIKLASLVITISKAGASGKRVAELLETAPSQTFSDKPVVPVEGAPKIEFKNVCLSYGGGNALENVSFRVAEGETVGVIGGTGSGKSSLINLIPRFYDATQGEVLLCGVNVKEYPKKQLRSAVAVVMQKPFLFSDTIRENLTLSNDLGEEEINAAISDSQSADVIAAKENGLDEKVLRGGVNFSGGQKQRLSVARALCKKSEVLILDDASSALDNITDAKLRKTIRKSGVTTIIVSQRASAVMDADKIIVLDNGRMVGYGVHDELLRSCPLYKEIYETSVLNSREAQ